MHFTLTNQPHSDFTEIIRVILTSQKNQSEIKVYNRTSSERVASVRTQWALEWGCNPDSFILVSHNNVLDDDLPFSMVPSSYPDIIDLLVEDKVSLPVRMQRKQEAKKLTVALSTLIEDLYAATRALFDLPENLPIRFWRGSAMLVEGRSLRESGVEEACGLELEVGWRLTQR